MYGTSMMRFTPRTPQNHALNVFNRTIEDLFGELARPGYESQESTRPWQPAVDIVETEQAYEVRAELPGVQKDDVQLAVENNVLTISGERKFEKEVDKENYHRIERLYGTFTRSFSLPNRVDAGGVQAKFENGVLTVAIPKAAEARPRKIEIG